MPVPFLLIGGVVGAVSLGMTAHSALKQRKWKKIHDEKLEEVRTIERRVQSSHRQMNRAGEALGRIKVQASETIEEAALYLRAVAKQYDLESLPDVPNEVLGEWISLRSEIAKSLGLGIGGAAFSSAAASAGSALYTAAGLFGMASTGARIAGLSGAAAHSARLAWIGGGAMAAGGGGVALGATILNVINIAGVVTAPIALGAGIWTEKKAHDLEKEVTAKLEEFAKAEVKLRRKLNAIQSSIPHVRELQDGVENTDQALRNLLQKAKALPLPASTSAQNDSADAAEPDLHLPHQIYLTAKTLRDLIEQPGISEVNLRILEEQL